MKTFILIASMFFASLQFTQAQERQQSPPVRNEYYQIFLDAPVQKVNKVTYFDDSNSPIEYKLSPDGTSIHLLNYKGEGGVKAEVVNAEGTVEEVIRSKCKIHSLQEL